MSFSRGSTTTAGGLVFRGDPDGNFLAIDAKTGENCGGSRPGSGLTLRPAVYEVNGEEYVAIATGGNQGALSANGDVCGPSRLRDKSVRCAPPAPQALAGPVGPIAEGVDTVRC